MPDVNVAAALGPGTILSPLSSSSSFTHVRDALSTLIALPDIESIPSARGTLRELVNAGASAFSMLSVVSVSLAQNVHQYPAVLHTLLPSFELAAVVMELRPLAQAYADDARSNSVQGQQAVVTLGEDATTLGAKIDSNYSHLVTLYSKIESHDQSLKNADICKTFVAAAKDLYILSSDPLDAEVQVSTLLDVNLSVVEGTFSAVFENAARQQLILAGLKNLGASLTHIRSLLQTLEKNFKDVVDISKALLGVWDSVAKRTAEIKDLKRVATAIEIESLAKEWEDAAKLAMVFINDAGTTPFNPSAFVGKGLSASTIRRTKVPQSQFEIVIQKFALGMTEPISVGVDATQATAGEDNKEVEKVLGPPLNTKQQLDNLSFSTRGIINSFDNLLGQGFVNDLVCTDPTTGGRTNVFNLVVEYRRKFISLQLDTIPVADDLNSYAHLQADILPHVTTIASSVPGDVTLETFIENNKGLCEQYKAKTSELSDRSTKFKNDWNNVINVVAKSINETNGVISELDHQIAELKKKKENRSFWDVIWEGVSDVFAVVTFTPGVGLLGPLGLLGDLGVQSILKMNEHDLSQAIGKLRDAVSKATAVRLQLDSVRDVMGNIAQNISLFSLFWSDLVTNMSKLDNFYLILKGPTGATLLAHLRPRIITLWKDVSDAVESYLHSLI